VIFIKKFVPWMFRISQICQFLPQYFHLLVREDSNSADVPPLMEQVDLILAETKGIAILISSRRLSIVPIG
jgi:hypothetical protein